MTDHHKSLSLSYLIQLPTRWLRSQSRETCSLTSCAASTGSDENRFRHDGRNIDQRWSRRHQCAWNGPNSPVWSRNGCSSVLYRSNQPSGDRQTQADCMWNWSET